MADDYEIEEPALDLYDTVVSPILEYFTPLLPTQHTLLPTQKSQFHQVQFKLNPFYLNLTRPLSIPSSQAILFSTAEVTKINVKIEEMPSLVEFDDVVSLLPAKIYHSINKTSGIPVLYHWFVMPPDERTNLQSGIIEIQEPLKQYEKFKFTATHSTKSVLTISGIQETRVYEKHGIQKWISEFPDDPIAESFFISSSQQHRSTWKLSQYHCKIHSISHQMTTLFTYLIHTCNNQLLLISLMVDFIDASFTGSIDSVRYYLPLGEVKLIGESVVFYAVQTDANWWVKACFASSDTILAGIYCTTTPTAN